MAALIACSSVPELTFVDDDGGVLLPDGAVVPRDSGPDVDPNCKPTGAEICDDGIDNDCNGAIDCQDKQCGEFSCQDAPPDWTAIEFAAAARPACPANTAMNDLRVSAGDGSATCNCSCASVGGSCTVGTWTVSTGTDATCGVATKAVPLSSAGACTALTGTAFSVSSFVARAFPPGPTMCAPSATVNGPITSGRMCQPGKYGKGCGTNQVCAPKPPAGAASCVTKLGPSACPGGFTKRSTAGTTEDDQRTCNGCACGAPSACAGGSVSLYTTSNCKSTGANAEHAENISTTCGAPTPDPNFPVVAFKSTAPAGGGCNATPTTPATAGGALTFTDQRTVCCK